MSASDHLNPEQFGFLPRPYEEWHDAMANTDYQGIREISTRHPLHTGQEEMYPERVQHYVQHPDSEHVGRDPMDKDVPNDLPYVYRYTGDDGVVRDYLGEGHHRLVAARKRGEDTIKVHWHEWGYPVRENHER